MIYEAAGGGNIDYVLSWGPMILGHAHPAVTQALIDAAKKGTSFGAPTALEVELARMICEAVPSMEMVRLVNSGTEATMSAIRLARGYTKRDKIIKFEGWYHGHAEAHCLGQPPRAAPAAVRTGSSGMARFRKHTITVP